ncbi:MAG: tetratricopeptide repeat protein [Verrucomicrobiaceae bacterium]|nr:tetratricopeptide repeat protein [Verrucomicrobiaceae bacterium]
MTDRIHTLSFLPTWVRGLVLLLLFPLLVYWPCINGPFLWDDRNWSHGIDWLLKDPHGLSRIWTQLRLLEQYYPVTASSVWLDYQLFGWETFPRHLENILMHGASCVLFWCVLRQLAVPGAWLAAAILAVHPVAVESVAWITERKNTLCLMFALGSVLAWIKSAVDWTEPKQFRVSWYLLSLILFLLALGAKISAFVVPPVVVLLAWWKRGRLSWRYDLLPALPMFLTAFGLGLIVAWLEKHQAGALGPIFDDLTWPKRIVLSAQALWFYVIKLLAPHPVCVVYYRWKLDPTQWWQWLPLLALLGALWALWKSKSRRAWILVLVFAIPLLPTLGFLNVNGMRFAWVADRWAYFSLPLACLFFSALFTKYCPRALLTPCAATLLALLGSLAGLQASKYRDVDVFWNHAIQGNPYPVVAHSAYGDSLMRAGRLKEAQDQFQRALALDPDNGGFHNNLGSLYNSMGKSELAKSSFETAITKDPSDPLFHYNLGFTLIRLGQIQPAEASLRKALELRPDFLAALNDLGSIQSSIGQFDEAEKYLQTALNVRPGDQLALNSLATLRYRQGRKAEALYYYEEVLKSLPDMVPTLTNAARIMATSVDSSLRDGKRAVELAERAAALTNHQDGSVLNTLAAAYGECGRFSEAVAAARRALELFESQGQPSASIRATLQVLESGQPVRVADRSSN